ncbi:MAG: NEW3 domain-containing protein [Syntrophorhabdaceae bacterium]|nr:NEW3 domain-containing protein [Syntrophorhabdaceae bacterium]
MFLMFSNSKRMLFWLCFAVSFLLLGSLPLFANNDKDKDNRPERGIGVYTEYSGVAITKGESVKMDLILDNKGKRDEVIDIKISSVPKGWKAYLKGGNYSVDGVYVPGGKTKNLSLSLEPDKTVGLGTYTFQFNAKTLDGALVASHKLNVTVQERTPGSSDIQITTSYPVIRGQSDAKFEYSLDILNKSEQDRTFNLTAIMPEKWEVNFKPSYESKYISSLRVKGGQSQTVSVEVTPSKDAKSGEYPFIVRVSSGDVAADVKLMVILTGNYKLDAGTPTGILSLEATAGKPTKFNIFVKNTGSAVNRNITFSSFKPENWDVTFKPEKIDALEVNELKQVEVTVKPAQQALVGDYSVGVMVNGEKSDKTIEMRVTVKASTAWGWIGVGIILFVIVGLSGLFIWFGRR